MRVADVMSRHVEFVEADAPVQEAAVLMGELDVGALPVGAPERLEGVLTDRDILYRVVARGLDCSAVRVRARPASLAACAALPAAKKMPSSGPRLSASTSFLVASSP